MAAVMLLSFAVNFLLLLGTARLAMEDAPICNLLTASLLASAYAGACLLPGLRFLRGTVFRLGSLVGISVLAFGWNRRTWKKGGIFVLLTMALGGTALAVGRGEDWMLLLYALVVCMVGRIAFGANRRLLPVKISGGGKTVELTALMDTGNELRDPVTGERVLLRRNEEVVEEIVDSAVIKLRRCPEALPVTVQRPKEILTAPMDATLMEQVILNLLENASVHAQGATRIWVMLRSQNDGVTIAVEDDGAGFDSQTLTQLFDRTALPHPKPCADGRRGLGLGLTVCYAIVKAHGGEMTAENRPEGGARVSLWLPGVKQEEENSCEAL